jgi:hypothetical protein
LVADPTITLGCLILIYRIPPHRGGLDAGKSLGVACVGETVTPFGATDFAQAFTEAKAKNPRRLVSTYTVETLCVHWTRAVEDQSAPIPEERTGELEGNIILSDAYRKGQHELQPSSRRQTFSATG